MIEQHPTILVTGGAGFIGSHLCESLLSEGYRVINIDNFNDYYSPGIKRRNIEAALQHKAYHLCEGDIRDIAFLDGVFSSFCPDVVVHLAAMAGVQPSLQNPSLCYDVNVNGTLQLLLTCVDASVTKFVFASSSSVYGNCRTPFRETDNTDQPISPYASSKKAGEVLCHVYHNTQNLSVHCLRFFTVVGPRQRPDLAVHKFVDAIMCDRAIQLRGNTSSSRDYTSVYDTVNGILGSIRRIIKEETPEYKIYNLGNSYPVKLLEMLRIIEKSLQKKALIERVDFMKGDVENTLADISLAIAELGYRPEVIFEEAVEGFVEWYQGELQATSYKLLEEMSERED